MILPDGDIVDDVAIFHIAELHLSDSKCRYDVQIREIMNGETDKVFYLVNENEEEIRIKFDNIDGCDKLSDKDKESLKYWMGLNISVAPFYNIETVEHRLKNAWDLMNVFTE